MTVEARSPAAAAAAAPAPVQSKMIGAQEGTVLQEQAIDREFFYLSREEDIHAVRRREILEKYPQIKDFFSKPEPKTKWLVTLCTLIQLTTAVLVSNQSSWLVFIAAAYIIGATCHQSQFLVIHEICHNLASKSKVRNRLYEFIANIPIAVPYSATYQIYHMDHHRYQGVEGLDPDLPEYAEAKFFSDKKYSYPVHCAMKALFLSLNLFFYAFRPLFIRPEQVRKVQRTWVYFANQIIIIVSDLLILKFFGIWPLVYLGISSLFAGSFHPTAGHFLAEHYVQINDLKAYERDHPIETYSYYGFWNYFTYNGGYHREHHDFPAVAWTNLPKIREIAREYYPDEGEVKSWFWTVVGFIFNPNVTLFSRVKRRPTFQPFKSRMTEPMKAFDAKIRKEQEAAGVSANEANIAENEAFSEKELMARCGIDMSGL